MTTKTYPGITGDDILLLCAARRIRDLTAEVERLRRELHDEQVRCDEWEKMYRRAVFSCGGTHRAVKT